jgi:acid phosphatase family membrane protein YuiD
MMFDFWRNLTWVLPLRSELLTPIMKFFTISGESLFLFYFSSIGFWIWRKDSFRRLMILGFISFLVNIFLKNLVQDPRPDVKYHLIEATGYGFPSGHGQIAMTFWIALAIEINRPLTWILCSFVALGLAFSRMYLGVHDPEDVFSGLIIGAIILFIFYRSKGVLYDWAMKFNLRVQLLSLWVLAGIILMICPGKIGGYLVYSCALLAAQGTGLILESRYVRFSISNSHWRRLVTAIFGISVLFSIIYVYQGYFPDKNLVSLFIYTSVICLWQTYFVPYFSVRFGLANK